MNMSPLLCVTLVLMLAEGAPVTDHRAEGTPSSPSEGVAGGTSTPTEGVAGGTRTSTEGVAGGASTQSEEVVGGASTLSEDGSGDTIPTTRRAKDAGPAPERWYTPCGPSDPHQTEETEVAPANGPFLPDIRHLDDLVNDVKTSAWNLTHEFKNTRFVDDQVIVELEQTEIPQYAEELLRLRSHSTSSPLNISDHVMMAEWLRMSVTKLSWVAAYLVLAQEEESPHERIPFKPRFARAEVDVYSIMCTLQVILGGMQVSPDVPLTRDEAIPSNVKFPDHSLYREQRDFLSLRDYVRYMDIFASDISIIIDSATT